MGAVGSPRRLRRRAVDLATNRWRPHMSAKKQVLLAAVVIASAAFASTAMAGKGGGPGGNALAPGQAGTNPGQVFKAEKRPQRRQFHRTAGAPTILRCVFFHFRRT